MNKIIYTQKPEVLAVMEILDDCENFVSLFCSMTCRNVFTKLFKYEKGRLFYYEEALVYPMSCDQCSAEIRHKR